MKKTILLFLFLLPIAFITAQELTYTQASDLNIIGRIGPAPHPYHRADTALYPELNREENKLVRYASGMAVVFTTNSPVIGVRTKYLYRYPGRSSTQIALAGYDLYIRRDGQWLYAASEVEPIDGKTLVLVNNMEASMKECLLYLPLFSEIGSLEIGVAPGSALSASENPFRHKIVFFGSSFTHGTSASRPGMSYPMQIERNTGLYIKNLGVSGHSELQPVFADMLAASGADAFVFDAFSNTTSGQIETRLIPFITRIRQSCPRTPMIFVQTIYRENNNFDLSKRAGFAERRATAERMMAIAMEQFKDVYFINIPNLTGDDHVSSTDGIHPSDLGYYRWANNLQPRLLEILAKYGIK